jgi:hypothetical protein
MLVLVDLLLGMSLLIVPDISTMLLLLIGMLGSCFVSLIALGF